MFNPSSILAPIDIEQESSWRSVLPLAARLAVDNDALLHVVAVVPRYGSTLVGGFFPKDYETQVMDTAKARLAEIVAGAELGGAHAKMHLARGTIYEEILRIADKLGSDLIVLAAHGPELKDYLLGPNAARVVRHAGQSVFVVRDSAG